MSKGGEIDLVSSRVYPGLERSPGRNDNWVEQTGGLPKYIERIAKHLHYEQGMTISRSIAVAVNTVKRWAKGGTVTAHGTTKRITPKTQALAIKAVAEWEAKKARAHVNLSVDLAVIPAKERRTLATKGVALPDGSFPIRNVADLRNAIRAIGRAKDPAAAKAHIKRRARALGAAGLLPNTWDLSEGGRLDQVIDLAMTKDGRKSFKGRGKWKHGFVPVDTEAKVAKAKGSPIAMRRMNRLFGTQTSSDASSTEKTSTGRAASLRRVEPADSHSESRIKDTHEKEQSKGGGSDPRARQPWESIPEADKTTRNGKRYVKSIFGGQQRLVEWLGEAPAGEPRDTNVRRLASLRPDDAAQMDTATIRRLLRVPGQPKSVLQVLNRTLRDKAKEAKK